MWPPQLSGGQQDSMVVFFALPLAQEAIVMVAQAHR